METGGDGISIDATFDPSYSLDSPEVNITISLLTYPSQTDTHICARHIFMVVILWSQSLPHLVNPFSCRYHYRNICRTVVRYFGCKCIVDLQCNLEQKLSDNCRVAEIK